MTLGDATGATTPASADEIIGLYERHAAAWDRVRAADLTLERAWVERFAAHLPAGGSVLDLGCGSGQPIARDLLARGFAVVGVDSSPTLIATCRRRFPSRRGWRPTCARSRWTGASTG